MPHVGPGKLTREASAQTNRAVAHDGTLLAVCPLPHRAFSLAMPLSSPSLHVGQSEPLPLRTYRDPPGDPARDPSPPSPTLRCADPCCRRLRLSIAEHLCASVLHDALRRRSLIGAGAMALLVTVATRGSSRRVEFESAGICAELVQGISGSLSPHLRARSSPLSRPSMAPPSSFDPTFFLKSQSASCTYDARHHVRGT